MSKKIKVLLNGKEVKTKAGIMLLRLLDDHPPDDGGEPLGAIINKRLMGLYTTLRSNSEIETFNYSGKPGANIYRRTVSLILGEAFAELYPDIRLEIGQSVGGGYYYHAQSGGTLDAEILTAVEERMREIVVSGRPLRPALVAVEEAIDYFEEKDYPAKVQLLRQRNIPEVPWVVMGEFRDLLFGPIAPSAGLCPSFALLKYEQGFVLKFPFKDGTLTRHLRSQKKLFDTYLETRRWNQRMSVWSISQLNQACIDGSISDIVKVSEGLQEKKISQMADWIHQSRDRVKLVLVAGPSSSGKTTFTKRLSVQLMVNGIRPRMLSMDNYYVNRVDTPKNADGTYDFECLEAIDIPLFNDHISRLLAGEEVQMPVYDFVKGVRRADKTDPMKIDADNVLIVEGIHGLNPKMSASVNPESKFKIYVSALTQLSIDEHNRIFTSDMRLMRRIVRDRLYRGYNAGQTISQWPHVRLGENRHIFPFQEEADIMFDTALVYEPAVLKPYLQRFLMEVDQADDAYVEAFRLFRFLSLFIPVFPREVPRTSLLREFIGGSSFDY